MDLYGKNINLQNEMESFIFGSGTEAPKGRDLVYRRIRKDSNGKPIECECVSSTTKESDKDTYCPYCLGSKYYWDEEFVSSYWHRPGNSDNLVFYFSHNVAPKTIDELKVILQGYTITVNNENIKKIADTVNKFIAEK